MAGSDLPSVVLTISGDVFHAKGQTGDVIDWSIHAEAEHDDEARCRVVVDGRQVADISVHAHPADLVTEVQTIGAALVWSAIRSVRMNRPAAELGGADGP